MNERAEGDRLRGFRVLVVEDDMTIVMMLEDFLEMSGCVVVGPAARVAKALALASTEEIDGALLDINLAGQEVYEVADRLSARNIPYAFTTGYQLKNVREAYRGRPFLRKPFSDKDLEHTLRALATPAPPKEDGFRLSPE